MDSTRNDIWLRTTSSVLRQAVIDSVKTLGVDVHQEDRTSVRLQMVHIREPRDCTELASFAGDGRPVILLVEPDAKPLEKSANDQAVAVLSLPFLSHELRVVAGRVLGLRVADAEIYQRADRPVPVIAKKDATLATDMEVTLPPKPPTLPTKRTLRTDELPPIDTFNDMPQVSFNESLPPLPNAPIESEVSEEIIHPTTINTMSAEYIEKVVWDVVPRLAERILREEIARLLAENSD